MISVCPSTSTFDFTKDQDHAPLQIEELGDVHTALTPIIKLFSGSSNIRLHCTVPTWCPSSDFCLDLHDLNDIRSRSLVFVHDLVTSLRADGISASYTLAPSNSSLCLICANASVGEKDRLQSIYEALQKARPGLREKVLLVRMKNDSALVIT